MSSRRSRTAARPAKQRVRGANKPLCKEGEAQGECHGSGSRLPGTSRCTHTLTNVGRAREANPQVAVDRHGGGCGAAADCAFRYARRELRACRTARYGLTCTDPSRRSRNIPGHAVLRDSQTPRRPHGRRCLSAQLRGQADPGSCSRDLATT
jgi:hypothetical protein